MFIFQKKLKMDFQVIYTIFNIILMNLIRITIIIHHLFIWQYKNNKIERLFNKIKITTLNGHTKHITPFIFITYNQLRNNIAKKFGGSNFRLISCGKEITDLNYFFECIKHNNTIHIVFC